MNPRKDMNMRSSIAKKPGRTSIIDTVRRGSTVEALTEVVEVVGAVIRHKAYVYIFVALPLFISLWYACAILFPPGARSMAPLLLWTVGAVTKDYQGRYTLCPRASICSEGIFEIILISCARLTAFASYVVCCLTFASKMHSSIHFLSDTYAGYFIPFEALHHVHKNAGFWYAGLATMHTATHFIRYYERAEFLTQMNTRTAMSGSIAMLAMLVVVWSMSVAKRFKRLSFEHRFNFHWFFILLAVALCFHHPRTRFITLCSFGLWALDFMYGFLFRTHRLDVVEFMPLPLQAGTQMLWRNPKGFKTKSGEFVRVKIPWLEDGGDEWHPFSLYLREATQEGLGMISNKGRIYTGAEAKGGKIPDASKTALLLIQFQNECCAQGGKIHDLVKEVMEKNGMLDKTSDLADLARSVGAQVIHAPFVFKESESPNSSLGIMKKMRRNSMFIDDEWGSDFVDSHAPKPGDVTITGTHGMDKFSGSNLEEVIRDKGLETLIICGLHSNTSVESTIRTAYEKGINVISLTDGTACNSFEEQEAAELNWKLFSTPMKCAQVTDILLGDEVSKLEAGFDIPEEMDDDFEAGDTLEQFVHSVLDKPFEGPDDRSHFLLDEARDDLRDQYQTTQIFIAPAGDWSKGVSSDVLNEKQGRSCWVRGPYTSPYFIATDFSNLILMASGIGITPALGVMGQYTGFSRTKILIWSIRSRNMLKFFTPLLSDCHLAVVFYTGKEKLTVAEVKTMSTYGNIYIQQSRPKSLTGTIESLIVQFEQEIYAATEENKARMFNYNGKIENIDRARRAAWCVLYCGGSTRIRDELYDFTKKAGTGWECELFDW